MTTGNNEYSVAIPPGALNVHIKLRDTTNSLKLYSTSVGNGGTPNPFYTVAPGTTLQLDTKLHGRLLDEWLRQPRRSQWFNQYST